MLNSKMGLSVFLVIAIFLFTPSPLERSSGDDYPSTPYYEQRILDSLPIPAVAAASSATVTGGGGADLNLTALFNEVDQSVVQISRSSQGTNQGSTQGSGFVYDDRGHILTNFHVATGLPSGTGAINPEEDEFQITFLDGTNYIGRVIGADSYSELAVLEVENLTRDKLIPLPLGDSSQLEIGEQVVAIGNPFGLSGSMTEGIVSGLGRTLPSSTSQGDLFQPQQSSPSFLIPNVIQTDAAINPGNSGGPLLKTSGEVVGMNTAIFSNTGVYAGVGFAIPSNIIKKVVPELISMGTYRHPYIGIAGVDVSPEIASAIGSNDSRGFLVTEVTAGSPADRAGIRGGDVLTAVDGRQIELGGDIIVAADNITVREIDDLLAYLETEKSVGENVVLRIIRDGSVQDIGVTLAPRPTGQEQEQEQEQEAAGEQRARPTLGINAINMSESIAERMNLTLLQDDFTGKGVLVVDVLSGGPADEAGIHGGYIVTNIDGNEIELGGDVIVAIDDTRIPSIDALRTFVEEKNIGDTIEVTIIRDNEEIVFPVTLGSTSELDTDQLLPNNGSAFSTEPPGSPPSGFIDDLYRRCLEALGPSVCDPIFGR